MVLIPSRREGLPVVAIQAAMMGRPIVATRVSGLPEVVVDGKTGWLVEREDSEGLAKAISFLLDHPKVAARMGRAAQQHARELFSPQRCVDAYDALYRKLGDGSPRADAADVHTLRYAKSL